MKPTHGGQVAVDDRLLVPGHPAFRIIGMQQRRWIPTGSLFQDLPPSPNNRVYVADAILRKLRCLTHASR